MDARYVGAAILSVMVAGAHGPEVGDPAPSILAEDAAGDFIRSKHLEGRVVLLAFWTLDPGTMSGMPTERLREVHRAFARDERFLVLTVCVNDLEDWEAWDRHVKRLRAGGPGWWDAVQADAEGPTTAERYGVGATPVFFLIGCDGRLAAARIPPAGLRDAVGRLLGGDQP